MKFDGRAFALTIEQEVVERTRQLVRAPKIVSILVGDDPASVLYTRLKEQAASRVGIGFEVVRIPYTTQDELKIKIAEIGAREDVTGVMLQLPIPNLQGQALKEVLEMIPTAKDVDGLRYPESGVVPPVVTAILKTLDQIAENTKLKINNTKVVVVGSAGFVGSGVMRELGKKGLSPIGVERGDDMRQVLGGQVVISAVGEEGIIAPEMVAPGAVVIDVGAPSGDMAVGVYQKASISVEVPGGIGPVTIACLMQNAVDLI